MAHDGVGRGAFRRRGLIWWGFDSGRLFAGIDRSTAEHERTLLHQEVAALRSQIAQIRQRLGAERQAADQLHAESEALARELAGKG